MPSDVFKPTGPAKISKPQAGGGNNNSVPLIGVVKDNIDPTRSGRIKVALQSGKGASDPNSSEGWVTVQYLSTFFGSVGGNAGSAADDHGTYKSNPSSYGMWHAPPDIGTQVVCVFINGDPNHGFYIGCIPEAEKLQMVPAIGAVDAVTLNESEAKKYGGATRLPVTNMNVNNKDKSNSDQFLDTARPVHSYTASIMNQQGIIRDPVRGPISSSASRETASRVGWGISTPGRPIYSGGYDDSTIPDNLEASKAEQLQVVARRGGHSIVMDDGDIIGRDQLIRVRTSLGHQILMSDDSQTLMILHSNGQSYIELGKEGTVDIYSTNSFNVRTQGDINFHADQNINLHAAENLNIQAKNIHTNSDEVTKFRAGTDFQVDSQSNFTVKAGAAAAIAAGGEGSLVAGGEAFVNGSKVNLNSGSPGQSPAEVPTITLLAQTDTLFDEQVGWAAAPGKLTTISSRTPTHAPWVNAGQGISIKTSASASDNLPPAPTSAVQQTNQASQTTGATPPAVATVASVPAVKAISATVDKGTTGAMLGATATAAAAGATKEAVKSGAAIIGKASDIIVDLKNVTVAVGTFGQTAIQLVDSGILKPGAATLINGLVSEGKKLVDAVPSSLFTGVSGAESLTAIATNVDAQATSMVNSLQKAQTALTSIGVLSGKETPTQSAGLITSAATAGVTITVNTVKDADSLLTSVTTGVTNLTSTASSLVGAGGAVVAQASGAINQFQGAVNSVSKLSGTASSVMGAIGAGGAAAGLASSMSGLGGIANSVNSLLGEAKSLSSLINDVQGISAAAFKAIGDGFPKLKANVPQNLAKTAKDSAGATATVASKPAGQGNVLSLSTIATAAISGTTVISGALKTIGGGTATLENTVAGVAGTFNDVSAITGKVNNTITSATGALNSVGGSLTSAGTEVTSLINKATGVTNAINGAIDKVSGLAGAAQAMASGGLSGLAKAATAVQSGGGAAQASALASGINNLPGGLRSASSIVDKTLASVHIPGTGEIASTIANAQTEVQNGISKAKGALGAVTGAVNSVNGAVSSATGSLSAIAGKASGAISSVSSATGTIGSLTSAVGDVTGALGKAAGQLNGLTSMVSSALGSGDASSLFASLSALSAGGASPIKLPEVGVNTFARDGITAQLKENLGDPGIPEPNLVGEVKPETISSLQNNLDKIREDKAKINEKIIDWTKRRLEARNDLINKINTLPEGDPAIQVATDKLNALAAEGRELNKQLDAVTTDSGSAAKQLLAGTPGGALLGV